MAVSKTRNADVIKEQASRWRRENPELAKAYGKAYREKRKLSDPDYYRRRNYKSKYGITLEDYNDMHEKQNGVCYICNTDNGAKRLAVDHCHETGLVRKLLCTACNLTVEHLENAKASVEKYVDYVKEHRVV